MTYNSTKKILVLGGYGNFGQLICDYLSKRPDIHLVIAGRNRGKAEKLSRALFIQGAKSTISTLTIDIHTRQLHQSLGRIRPDIVIHTCGPFQGQDYHVPDACIESGCHYIDLADDRHFVCDFNQLNDRSILNNVIAVSGASSVPGLSSVAIDHYADEFAILEEIKFCIAPGSNVDMGEATLKGILSGVGQAFECWEQGGYTQRYGWMDNHHEMLGQTLGTRWLANVDIPDLELFPVRYPGIKTVRFQAGHELGIVHLSITLMAILVKHGMIKHWDRFSSLLYKAGRFIKQLGTDSGGMVIQLTGTDKYERPQKIVWRLIAKSGEGPRIPTISAIILAEKILDGVLTMPGAYPCLGMFTFDEFLTIASAWSIYQEEERTIG